MSASGETARLRDLESKALSVGSGPDGGYLVPDRDRARGQPRADATISPIRAIAGVRQVSGSVYKKPFAIDRRRRPAGSARRRRGPQTDDADAGRARRSRRWSSTPCRRRPRRCSTTPPSTSTSGSPRRCASPSPSRRAPPSSPATAPTSRRASSPTPRSRTRRWTWGNIGYHRDRRRPAPSRPSNPADKLIDLVYALKAGYRANAHFVMNRATQAAIRKLKDADGNYLWQPAAEAGRAADADGLSRSPSREDMPDIAADSLLDRLRRLPRAAI